MLSVLNLRNVIIFFPKNLEIFWFVCTLLSFPCSLVSSEMEEITICVPSLESKHPQSQILIESVGTFGLLGVSSLDISQF